MIPVFICEDSQKQREFVESCVKRYIMIHEAPLYLALSTPTPIDMMHHIEQKQQAGGIYFLDIDLQHELNGVDIARAIRERDDLAKIIFVTTREDFLPMTIRYQIAFLDFIPKSTQSEMQERIYSSLTTSITRSTLNSENKKRYVVKQGNKEYPVPYDEILYFETSIQPHMIDLLTLDGYYSFYSTIKEIKKLGDPFLQIGQSHVINLDNLQQFDLKTRSVTMKNNKTLSVSQRSMSTIKKQLKARSLI